MANRYADWLRQAEADLRHARNALEDGDHEWACFAAQQAEAEAAIVDAAAILEFCHGAMG